MAITYFNLKRITMTTNTNGELVISGSFEGIPLNQVLSIPTSSIIMFDIQNKNFYAIAIDRHDNDDQFVTIL